MLAPGPSADLHVLLFNLRMDADDPVLGFTTRWVEALAERVRRVTVVTMHAGRVVAPANVRVLSVGRERGLSEARRAVVFGRLCARICREDRPDVAFAHMIPVFATLFAPFRLRYRIPVLLWYAHGAVPWSLRVAHAVTDRCITSAPGGFKLPSPKLHVLGQGIDTAGIAATGEMDDTRARTIVSVGRITAVKRLIEAVDGLAALHRRGVPARLELTGGPATDLDLDYERRLRDRIAEHGLGEHVALHGPVPFERIAAAYAAGAVHVNLSRHGPYDKALLESVVAGCLPVSDNESFRIVAQEASTEFLVPGEGPEALADTFATALGLAGAEREGVLTRLRDKVVSEHSLDRLVDRVVEHLQELAASAG